MKKSLILTMLSILILAQGSVWAESMTFTLSVTIPSSVQIPAAEFSNEAVSANSVQAIAKETRTQIAQEQQIVRNQQEITVRSIVAL